MNHKNAQIAYLILFFITVSCSPKVIQFVNTESSFDTYKTFGITNFKSSKDLSPEGREVFSFIESQINDELNRRDYIKDNQNPDMVIRYELISNQRSEVNSTYNPYNRWNPTVPTYGYNVRTVLESALLIEIFDADTKKLVWQASLDLKKQNGKVTREEILKDAVTKLFNTYLYRAESKTTDQSLLVE